MYWAERWLPAALSPLINNDNICFVCFDSFILTLIIANYSLIIFITKTGKTFKTFSC